MSRILQLLTENTRGRDFVVGDLHGYYSPLMERLEELRFDPTCDRVLAVGDLIDRGPDSVRCLELVKESWFFSVQGNHERFLIHSLTGDADVSMTWLLNGGRWSSLYTDEELQDMAQLIQEKMPLALEVPCKGQQLGIIHAEVPQDDWNCLRHWRGEMTSHLLEVTTTLRTRIRTGLAHRVHHIDAVVCGHTLVPEPTRLGNVHYLETGICAPQVGGYLSIREVSQLLADPA
ncbi:metallophosphoesterase [Marinospirillum alkaliphilum]|uniref:Serine/threonine protein phosphatase 1 n=1 Tax=Marinospirillum alkaliphilum DSM 21637 TaxID=1122209 RepID=A0A1K1TZC8_9GAMM|nr:metallophosphoesterase [Marinospirillum alkaliphilum]SFX05549.1 serine/threonine protein phosphatase 1 [Marinospirillum alkaliphilum DSM 21637]